MPEPIFCSCYSGPHLSAECMTCGWQARRAEWKLVFDVDEGRATLYGPFDPKVPGKNRLIMLSWDADAEEVRETLRRLRKGGLDVDYTSDEA